MMRLLTFILLTVISNCLFSQDKSTYKVIIDKELWKNEPIIPSKHLDEKYLKDGNLHVHFPSSYKNDTTTIKVNGKEFGTYLLTTEWSSELADIIVIPGFENITSLTISINNGPEGIIEIAELNQVEVSLRNGELKIGLRKHVMYYD
ncbi:MAG: hypothetical protein RJQ14_07650 [Marinoscillum sp.]